MSYTEEPTHELTFLERDALHFLLHAFTEFLLRCDEAGIAMTSETLRTAENAAWLATRWEHGWKPLRWEVLADAYCAYRHLLRESLQSTETGGFSWRTELQELFAKFVENPVNLGYLTSIR